MKYSLRSLMVDALLALPFLLFGAFAVYCAREAIHRYEEVRIIGKLRFATEMPISSAPGSNSPGK